MFIRPSSSSLCQENHMAFHFCTRAWEVRDIADGTMVTLKNRDLNEDNLPVLVDDLHALVLESGSPNLYLDFSNIGLIDPPVLDQLVALNEQIRANNGRAILTNLNTRLNEMIESAGLSAVLDVRAKDGVLTAR